eukprot:scaffold536440_cov19-Prasinocladus_malaysianus.AAC.1
MWTYPYLHRTDLTNAAPWSDLMISSFPRRQMTLLRWGEYSKSAAKPCPKKLATHPGNMDHRALENALNLGQDGPNCEEQLMSKYNLLLPGPLSLG